MKLLLTIIPHILLLTCFASAQTSRDIAAIEFNSITRGSYEKIVITHDSVTVHRKGLGSDGLQKTGKKITPKAWKQVLKSLNGISLAEIPDLKSPTMKRAYDGARHGTLLLTTNDGQSWSHPFDDENPHEKLIPLMKAVRGLADKAVK